ncbi:TPA: DUF1364 domain-containing protein [Neisseria meningitidis]
MSSAIRKAAKGEQCTLNIAGVCNHNPETVVLCHFPSETHGMGLKSDDLSAGFGCRCCHDAIDGRSGHLSREDKEFYMRRSQFRTIRRLEALGIVSVKGRLK